MAGSQWRTIEEFYPYFLKCAKNIGYCKEIRNHVSNKRIRRLVNGYVTLDLLAWDGSVKLTKFKMWQFFEDLVGEILREILKDRSECTVVNVDRIFKGLDYVVANSKSGDGWKVGIQCKRYIGSALSRNKLDKCSSWARGTSAAQLLVKGKELRQKWGSKKKFVLVCFNAFRGNELQNRRFKRLNKYWNRVIVIDESVTGGRPYTYKLAASGFDTIVNWA